MRPGLFGGVGGEGARKTSRNPSSSDDAPPSKRVAQASPGGRRPAFNPGLLASPFYGGPTMYGGAGACNSASPRARYASLFYERRNQRDVKATPAKTGGAMSQTSKRIWELLAHYSTPISDAMRAPPARPPSETSDAEPDRASQAGSSATQQHQPRRLRELRVPGMAALLKLKRNNRSAGSAQAALAASLSSSLPYEPEDYSLNSDTPSAAVKTKRDRLESRDEPQPTTTFLFSAPSRPRFDSSEPPAKRFTFRDPFDALNRPNERLSDVSTVTSENPVRLWNGTGADKSPKTALQENQKEPENKNPEPKPSATSTLSEFIKKQRSQWECSSCLSLNDSNKNKCPCCEAPKPGTEGKSQNVKFDFGTSTPGSFKFGINAVDQPTKRETTKPDLKSVSQELSPKIAEKKVEPEPKKTPTPDLSEFIKKQRSQWECSSCLSLNDNNRNKCPCCEAPKPGTEDNTHGVKFNFGSSSSGGFKFGIDAAAVASPKTNDDSKKSESTGGFLFGLAPAADTPKVGNEIKFGIGASTDTKTEMKFGIANGTVPVDSDKNKFNIFNTPFDIKTGPTEKTNTQPAAIGTFTFGTKLAEKTPEVSKPSNDLNNTPLSSIPTIVSTKPIISLVGDNDKTKNNEKDTNDKVEGKVEPEAKVEAKETAPVVTVSSPGSTPSIFSFNAPQPKSVTSFGSTPQFNFGSNTLSSSPSKSTPESTFKPNLFTFGAKSPTASESAGNTPEITFSSTPNKLNTSLFSVAQSPANITNIATQNSTLSKDLATSPLGAQFQLSAPTVSEKAKEQAVSTPVFSFTSPVSTPTSSAAAPSMFKTNNVSTAPVFTFGSSATSKPEPSNKPIFGSKSPTGIFGSQPANDLSKTTPNNGNSIFKTTTATTVPTFSSISGNMFGSKVSEAAAPVSGNLFGNVNAAGDNKPAQPVFGASTLNTSGTQPSIFPVQPASSFNSSNIFGSAQTSNASPQQQRPTLFGAQPVNKTNAEPTGGIFGSKLPTTQSGGFFGSSISTGTPALNTGGIFGSHPAIPTPVFGASIPFGDAAQSQPEQNVPFKFGSTNAAQTPGAGFGQVPAAGSSAPVFSFGSSAAAPAPSMNSQFNFSMGAPTPQFPSTPGANPGMQARRFKKAVRRNVPR